jgi:hypothetical protein
MIMTGIGRKIFSTDRCIERCMTCYFRHMERVFKKAGLQIDVDNRKRVDLILHEMAGVNYKDCVRTWKAIKELLKDEEAFVQRLREECLARNIELEY